MEDVQVILEHAITLNTEKKWNEVVLFLPDSVLKTYKSSDLYAEKAQAFWFLKDFSESKRTAEIALEISLNAKAYQCLGRIGLENEDYALAEEYFKKAIQTDSNYLLPFYGLSVIYRSKKEFKISEEYLKRALEIDLANPSTYNALGNLYVDLENYLDAEEYYKKSLEIDSKYTYAYTGLGNVALSKKDYNLAKEYYTRGIEIDPNNSVQHYNLGLVYSLLNEKSPLKNTLKKRLN